ARKRSTSIRVSQVPPTVRPRRNLDSRRGHSYGSLIWPKLAASARYCLRACLDCLVALAPTRSEGPFQAAHMVLLAVFVLAALHSIIVVHGRKVHLNQRRLSLACLRRKYVAGPVQANPLRPEVPNGR